MSFIQSFGAAETVTGSCHLLQLDQGLNILIDCGYFQGADEKRTSQPFEFDPKTIDILLITHAHLDHVGRIPKLVKEGFDGRIIATRATMELAEVVWVDSAKIAKDDYEIACKKAEKTGETPPIKKPIYSLEDVKEIFNLNIQYANYNKTLPLASNIKATFRDAGHILGSATIQIELIENGKPKNIVFTGDLGSRKDLIMPLPTSIKKADLLYIESTYGDRNHPSLKESVNAFKSAVINTLNNQGNVLIPSFAIERSQEVLLLLKQMFYDKELPACKVFLDSPMAIRATRIYTQYHQDLNGSANQLFDRDGAVFDFPCLQYALTENDSKLINDQERGSIIIAGSGMCSGGRILQHFRHRLSNPCNSVIFVGYQVEGTLGRQLIDGVESIQLYHESIPVNAQIEMIHGFSAHADQSDLLAWLSEFDQLGQICLIHGEPEKQHVLKQIIKEQFNKNAHSVKYAEKVAV